MGLIGHPTNAISEAVIGAAIEVHRQLGPGLLNPAIMPASAASWSCERSRIRAKSAYLSNTKERRLPGGMSSIS